MTVKEAFETILDKEYPVQIRGEFFENYSSIPEKFLDSEIYKIRPRHSKNLYDYYRIRLLQDKSQFSLYSIAEF